MNCELMGPYMNIFSGNIICIEEINEKIYSDFEDNLFC